MPRLITMLCFMTLSIFGSSLALTADDVTVSAGIDREELGSEDTLTLSVVATMGADSSAEKPNLQLGPGFEIINSWQSQEARSSFTSGANGNQFQTHKIHRFNYLLHPKKIGTLSLPPVEVKVDGKIYRSKPLSVKVVAGHSRPTNNQVKRSKGRDQQNPFNIQVPPGFMDEEDEDLFSQLLKRGGIPDQQGFKTQPVNPEDAFFVQVEVDKTEAFVNEQVTASWYLYTRGQIRDLDTLKYPSLKGFWKEDIEIATHLNFTDEVVNGVPYKKALLASFALFPIKEGTAFIDPYTAKCTVVTLNDIFGSFGNAQSRPYTKSSQPVKVTVKPLPNEGRPTDFSGAVGSFQVSARIDDTNIVEGQPFTLKIHFEGRGNAKLIDVPPFTPPEGLELYDTQKEAKFFKSGASYKDFKLLMIPRRDGDFTIPPVSASIFDPQKKTYLTQTTEPITIKVQKGQPGAKDNQPLAGLKSADSPKVVLEPTPQKEFKSRHSASLATQGIGFGGLFALVSAVLFWRARIELGWGQKKKDLMRRLRVRLDRVNDKAERADWRGVGVELTNCVYFVLGEVSGQGGANLEIEKLLLRAPPSIRRELGAPLLKQMEILQTLTFAPESAIGALKSADFLKRLVKEIQGLMENAVSLGLSSEQSDEKKS